MSAHCRMSDTENLAFGFQRPHTVLGHKFDHLLELLRQISEENQFACIMEKPRDQRFVNGRLGSQFGLGNDARGSAHLLAV